MRTKSDSDVILCLQLLSKNYLSTSLDLMRIDRSLVYKFYPEDMINTQVIYRLQVLNNVVNKNDVTVTLDRQDSKP